MIGKTILAAAALMMTGLAGQAGAQTLFSDMGTQNSYGSPDYLITATGGRSTLMPEFQFTATTTGSLSEIDMALFGSGLPGTVNAVLMASAYNAPAQVLGTFAVTNLPTDFGFSIARATGISGVTLTAGTTYYLGAEATGASTMYAWAANTTGATGRIADLAGTHQYYLGSGTTAAFSLVSIPAAVPEPASWAMMVVGVGLLGHALRRRRSLATEAAIA